jgi:hypothetical protein
MKFVSDPGTLTKIQKMQERVRWNASVIRDRKIDQTRFVLNDGKADHREFSFLVLGDSGSGQHPGHNAQRRIAEQMVEHQDDCRFILHTGDVVYLVGSSEYYPKNFIKPYRDFLVNGEEYETISYDQMVFKVPFLPVLGNHDYYDLPLVYILAVQMTYPLRRLLRSRLSFDIGWHGSYQGKAYTQAFLDPLWLIEREGKLEQHLDRHYIADTPTGRCLQYEPGVFTRLPNRYYTFRYGGVDFFALDSNTFNEPVPLSNDQQQGRRILLERRKSVDAEMQQLIAQSELLNLNDPEAVDQMDDIRVKLEQLEEIRMDVDKQLNQRHPAVTDTEQLNWFRDRLIASWRSPEVRARVVYFHHPPYVTEASKWYQAQTLAVRYRLRDVFNQVAAVIDTQGRGIVDLVLHGHAHCFEYLRTTDTGHADSKMNWIICGGSGYSLRRQRAEGADLYEDERLVAKSQLFVGREGRGSHKRRPYSFLRIDVTADEPVKFVVRPFVSEWRMHQWHDRALEPFVI